MRARSLVVLVVFAAGCGCDVSYDGGADAAVDGSRDAGRDGGPRDAGARDAGTDAGRDGGPTDPGWAPLEGASERCSIERATFPDRVYRLEWEACPGIDGCRRVVRPSGAVVQAWFDSGRGFAEILAGTTGERIIALVPVDGGPAIAAWRGPRSAGSGSVVCSVDLEDVRAGTVAVSTLYYDGEFPDRSVQRVYAAPLGEIAGATTAALTLPAEPWVARGRTIRDLRVAPDFIAFQMEPDGNLYAARGGEIRAIHDGTDGLVQNLALVGEHMLWESWGDHVRLEHAGWDTPRAFFRELALGDARSFGTDGSDVAWLEGTDRAPSGTYGTLTLRAGRYSAALGVTDARDVRSFSSPGIVVVGGGWYAVSRASPERIDVFSLRDGSVRSYLAPTGERLGDPLYVTANELLISADHVTLIDPNGLPVVDPGTSSPP